MKKWRLLFCLLMLTLTVALCSIYFQKNIFSQEKKEYKEITMVLPTYGFVPDDMELVTSKMNEISIKKCGIKVNYIYTNVSELYLNCSIRLKAGEEIDLMPSMNGEELNSYISEEMISELDPYLENEGSLLYSAYPKNLWKISEKNGKHYSVCALDQGTMKEGLLIRTDVLEKIGVNEEEILSQWELKKEHNYKTLDEVISPVFEKIKKSDAVLKDGTKVKDMFLGIGYNGIFSQIQLINFDGFGNNFGGILNGGSEVVNLYETEAYKDMVEVARKWVEKGYVHPVDSQVKENTALWYETGTCFGMFTDTSQENQKRISQKSSVETTGITLIKGKLNSTLLQIGNWVIPSESQHKEEAVKILDLMYTDPEYVTLYVYGIEGVHYKSLENGEKKILSNRYTQHLTWIFGNVRLADEGTTAIESVKAAYENAISPLFDGFQYDDQLYHTQIEKMQKYLEKNLSELENGQCKDTETVLKELNDTLYGNGLLQVMRDKQRQLDNWLKKE